MPADCLVKAAELIATLQLARSAASSSRLRRTRIRQIARSEGASSLKNSGNNLKKVAESCGFWRASNRKFAVLGAGVSVRKPLLRNVVSPPSQTCGDDPRRRKIPAKPQLFADRAERERRDLTAVGIGKAAMGTAERLPSATLALDHAAQPSGLDDGARGVSIFD